MSMIGNGVLISMASVALVLSGYNSLGQSLDDSAAREQLAEERRECSAREIRLKCHILTKATEFNVTSHLSGTAS